MSPFEKPRGGRDPNRPEGPRLWETRGILLDLPAAVEDMREAIEKHEFGLLIGSDPYGRLPAIVMKQFLADRYAEKGEAAVPLVFFAESNFSDLRYEGPRNAILSLLGAGFPGQAPQSLRFPEELSPELFGEELTSAMNEKLKKLKEYLEKEMKDRVQALKTAGQKALIVVATVEDGIELFPLCRALEASGVQYDILTLTLGNVMTSDEGNFALVEQQKRVERFLHTRLHVGSYGNTNPAFSRSYMHGVKSKPEDLFSEKLSGWLLREEMSGEHEDVTTEVAIQEMRKEAKKIANVLLYQYKKGGEKKE